MTTSHQPARKRTCLSLVILGMAALLIAIVVVPRFINSRAELAFGPASPQLSYRQHIYLSMLLLLQSSDLTQPVTQAGKEVNLTISPGESVPSITGKLWESGLISNPGVFRNYLQY